MYDRFKKLILSIIDYKCVYCIMVTISQEYDWLAVYKIRFMNKSFNSWFNPN